MKSNTCPKGTVWSVEKLTMKSVKYYNRGVYRGPENPKAKYVSYFGRDGCYI